MMVLAIAGIALASALVLAALYVISRDLLRSQRAQAEQAESSEQIEARGRDQSAGLVKEAVLESEARLNGIIESAMDAIITVDEGQRIVLFNPAAEQMFQCPAAHALGHPLDQLIPERFRSAHTQHVRKFGETRADGLQVLQRIKSDPRTKLIPVVVLTSSKEQRDVVAGYELGANSYIVKPVAFDGFAKAMQELGMYWMLLNNPPTT